ncbi:anti-sigma factor [Mycobacterium paraterrae]|uniref:Anti-sigma-K factor RskA n=1 Tax=Mycobacterium paraterrae TaxID=577492 RepID=A0ABY3VHZ9_9MYCO|nr:anti-sigma factor [Mycobacterium paraterrae]UMB68946.1 anti-sigma factor [Mycobacterium paraterrae]
MTGPADFGLLELATPYALNAISDDERASIDRQLAAAPSAVVNAFNDEVRAVREALAVVSAATATEPPDRLRAAVLARVQRDSARPSRWRTALLAAAAAIVVALAAFGAGIALRPHQTPTMAEQIMAAPDVRTASTPIAGGTATVVFSRERNGAVLLMNNVPPPTQGTVYQMWLVGDKGPQSAGTMDAAAVLPSTTHTFGSLQNSSMLAFTVEPGDGSPQPTGKIFAKLPLT